MGDNRKYQDGIADEASRNIVAELRKKRTFGGFSEERMWLVLDGMWNKVEYTSKDSQKRQVKYKSVMIQKEWKIYWMEAFLNIIL